MASEVKTNKVSPATSTTLNVGDSGDTLALAVDSVTGFKVGSDAAGDVLYNDGTDYTRLAKPGTPADEVLTFATGATAPSWVAAATSTNTPAFFAYLSANQTVTDNTTTKLECDSELFDTASAYDNSTNYRFTVPAGEGGKYLVTSQISYINGNNTGQTIKTMIYVGGSQVAHAYDSVGGAGAYWNDTVLVCQTILVLSATDYVEAYGLWDIGSGTPGFGGGDASTRSSWFSAFKLAGA